MQHATPSVWTIVALGTVVPVLIVLFFRMMMTKTSKGVAINFALGIGVGLVISVILSISGLGPSSEELRQAQNQAPKSEEMLRAIPWEIFVAATMWMIGGNYILLRQRRKAGESWGEALNPFAPFGRHMDRRSWSQILLLVFLSLAVAQFGLGRNSPPLRGDAQPVSRQELSMKYGHV